MTEQNVTQKVEELEFSKPSQKLKIDLSKFEGMRVPIEEVEVVDATTDYNLQGLFEEGLKRPVKKLEIRTKVLETIQRDGKEPILIRARVRFGLKREVQSDGSVKWTVSQDKKSKLWKFIQKQKVNSAAELKGTLVTLTVNSSGDPEDDREFLGIAL